MASVYGGAAPGGPLTGQNGAACLSYLPIRKRLTVRQGIGSKVFLPEVHRFSYAF